MLTVSCCGLCPPSCSLRLEAEAQGWIDRSKLLDFNGRGRSRQIALAKELGLSTFQPGWGCILADPILSRRIARINQGNFIIRVEDISVEDVRLLLMGRQFILPGGGWLILGRNACRKTVAGLGPGSGWCALHACSSRSYCAPPPGRNLLSRGSVAARGVGTCCGAGCVSGERCMMAPGRRSPDFRGRKRANRNDFSLTDEVFQGWQLEDV